MNLLISYKCLRTCPHWPPNTFQDWGSRFSSYRCSWCCSWPPRSWSWHIQSTVLYGKGAPPASSRNTKNSTMKRIALSCSRKRTISMSPTKLLWKMAGKALLSIGKTLQSQEATKEWGCWDWVDAVPRCQSASNSWIANQKLSRKAKMWTGMPWSPLPTLRSYSTLFESLI